MRMKSLVLATTLAAVAVPTIADAAVWQPIAQRKVNIDRRIDQGIRSGELNRAEARRLTRQLSDLVALERRYRASRPGLTLAERRDLDRRYDGLSQRVFNQKHDAQVRY